MSCLGWGYIFVSPSFTYHLGKVSGGWFVVLQTFLQTSNKSVFGYMVQLRSSIDYKKVRKKWFFGEPKTFRSSFRRFFKFSFLIFFSFCPMDCLPNFPLFECRETKRRNESTSERGSRLKRAHYCPGGQETLAVPHGQTAGGSPGTSAIRIMC